MDEATGISARIAGILRAAGLNQEKAAACLHVSQPAVSRYLKGQIPPATVLLNLAGPGNSSVEWIMVGEADPEAETPMVREGGDVYGAEKEALWRLWQNIPPQFRPHLRQLMAEMARQS